MHCGETGPTQAWRLPLSESPAWPVQKEPNTTQSQLTIRGHYRGQVGLCFRPDSRKSPLLNDPIRLCEHLRRNRQADLFGRLEIDDELQLRRLLDWNIARLGTFQNLVYVRGG